MSTARFQLENWSAPARLDSARKSQLELITNIYLYGNYLPDRCLQTGLYYCFGHLHPVGSLHDPVPLRWDRAYPDPDLNPDLSRSPPELEGMGRLSCCDSSHRGHHLLDHFDDPHDL